MKSFRLSLFAAFLCASLGAASNAFAVAPTLSAGDIAIIGYNSDGTDNFAFVALRSIGSGTVIRFTDQSWNGSAFSASGSDSTVTFTASADIAAGTVIPSTSAQFSGSLNLDSTGDTIYAYQGAVGSPTNFVYAIEFADGNTTFNGSLANTGLTVGTSAVAIAQDNGAYAGPTNLTQAGLLAAISSSNHWVGADNGGQTAIAQAAFSGPFEVANPEQIWIAGAGDGSPLIHIDITGTGAAANEATIYENTNGNSVTNPAFVHPAGVALDTVHGLYFVADSNGSTDRILQGNLSAAANTPGITGSVVQLWTEPAGFDTNNSLGITNIRVDTVHSLVYFTDGAKLFRVAYNTPNQTASVIADLGTNNDPKSGNNGNLNFADDFAIDVAHGVAYILSAQSFSAFAQTTLSGNTIWKVSGLSGSPTITELSFADSNPADASTGAQANPHDFNFNNGELLGIDIDPATGFLYVATTPVNAVGSGFDYQDGGVFRLDPTNTSNVTDIKLADETSNTTPHGLLKYIAIDPSTNKYYLSLNQFTNGSPQVDQSAIYSGSMSPALGTLTKFADVVNVNGLGPQGLTIEHAPTLSFTNSAPTFTEPSANPASTNQTPVTLIANASTSDLDPVSSTDQLVGATVTITNGLFTGDQLTATTTGTNITASYTASTGVLALSGTDTFAHYQTVLNSVKFGSASENPTNYGTDNSRTISWSVSDGLLSSVQQTSTVTVVGVNDPPVNAVPGAQVVNEDTNLSITGLSISDPDANPATASMTTTLAVSNGNLTMASAGGASVSGGGTDSVTLTGTTTQINTTLAAANNVVYRGAQDYFGSDTLVVTTDDGGNTGTGGAKQDIDNVGITVNSVNDVPSFTKGGDQTVLEDAGAQTVTGWATNISVGPANESSQTPSFLVNNINNGLFSSQPAISAGGDLTYTPAANANGTALVTVQIHDNGGTAYGGVDTSAAQTFNINVTAVNDAPTLNAITNPTKIPHSSGAQTVNLSGITAGPNESQTLTVTATSGNTALIPNPTVSYSSPSATGSLSYTPVANQGGTALITVTVKDDGGTANNGVDTVTRTFTVTVGKPSQTALQPSKNPSLQGSTVTFTATVTPSGAGGTVAFSDGASPIACTEPGASTQTLNGSGIATCTTSTLDSANSPHTINADYSGDSTYDASSGTLQQTVNPCTNPAIVTTAADDGAGSLRQAIADVCDGGTITFDMTQVVSPITLTSGELVIDKNVTITGPGADILTVMRSAAGGTADFRIFEITNGTVEMAGLKVSNGSFGSGAGIRNDNATSLTLDSMVVDGNHGPASADGSGIYSDGGLVILNSTISNNTAGSASYGGGIECTANCTALLSNSTVSTNTAGEQGGGIRNAGVFTIVNSTIAFNTLTDTQAALTRPVLGGGIYNAGTLNLQNTIVANNTAETGPDVYGTITTAGHNLIRDGSGATITATTGDQVGTSGAPVEPLLGTLGSNGGPTQTHLLGLGSRAVDAGGDVTTLTQAVTDNVQTTIMVNDASTFPVSYALTIGSEDLLVVSRAGNQVTVTRGANGTTAATHSAGDAVNPAFDERGFPRKANGTIDIGAVEANYAIAISSGSGQSASVGNAFTNALVAIVTESNTPVSGVSVAFTAPASDPTGTFPGPSSGATTSTNSSGLATGPTFTAGTIAGSYNVSATATDIAGSADFQLTNTGGNGATFLVAAPATATAGTAIDVTVTARDQFGNTATDYAGTIHFTASDGGATVPTDYTFVAGDHGVHTFSGGVTLVTAGNQTITAADTTTTTITGASNSVVVSAAAATHLVIDAPTAATTGAPFNFSVTALDQHGNTATGYAGTVHFTSTDGAATLPADATLTDGAGTLSATLNTTGGRTITGTDTAAAGITGTSGTIQVTAPATHFSVTAPANATAGASLTVSVTALDASNNVASGYSGTVHLTSSDGAATLPADSSLTNGQRNFNVTLKTAGGQTVTATDTNNSSVAGTSSSISVSAASATTFSIAAPSGATAGAAFNFTVTAKDQFNNSASGYTGTIHFTSTDGKAGLPADTTLTNGVGTLSTTMKTAGQQTITGTDKASTSINGTSSAINVAAASANHFAVSAPASATAGTAFHFTVIAQDQFNNTATGYAGTLHFTSSDAHAVLPADSALANGVRTFSATLKTIGNQTITSRDKATSSIAGRSAVIVVSAGATPTPTATPIVTPTVTPKPTATATPKATPTATPKGTPTPAATATPTPHGTATPTPHATATPSATPSASPTPTATATPTPGGPRLDVQNVSTRERVGTGQNVMIGGFIITGDAMKKVLIRGLGASLESKGIHDFLADPVLELHGPNGSVIGNNDNWRDTQEQQIIASKLAPETDLEAAIIITLKPGAYTAIVKGKEGATGVGLVEVYDLSKAVPAQLANISTRGFVQMGEDVMIGGFVLGGNDTPAKVVIRALGGSLVQRGVKDPLEDPILELHNGNGDRIDSNDNWTDNAAQAAEITANHLAPTDPREAALAETLAPGKYTAIVTGKDAGTGVALVEIYRIP
jgi:hypothetical protein